MACIDIFLLKIIFYIYKSHFKLLTPFTSSRFIECVESNNYIAYTPRMSNSSEWVLTGTKKELTITV